MILEIGGFRLGYEGSQDWDLVLRATEKVKSNNIIHISEILYHWRIHESSVSMSLNAKNYAVSAAESALQDFASSINFLILLLGFQQKEHQE